MKQDMIVILDLGSEEILDWPVKSVPLACTVRYTPTTSRWPS